MYGCSKSMPGRVGTFLVVLYSCKPVQGIRIQIFDLFCFVGRKFGTQG